MRKADLEVALLLVVALLLLVRGRQRSLLCRTFGTANIATLRRRFDAGEYLQCSYEAETGNTVGKHLQQLVDRLRGQQLPSAEGIVVSKHSLMLFVGKGAKPPAKGAKPPAKGAETSTKFHVDWTKAKNVALALSEEVRWQSVRAVLCSCAPCVAQPVNAVIAGSV